MKKLILITGLFLYQTISFSQTAYSGILDHTSSYFTINPFDSSYDDGTFAKIFYDGNNRRLNFWNSDNNYTNLRVGIINSYGYISVDKSSSYRVAMNGQSDGYITGRNDAVEQKFQIHSNGHTFFNGGNVGIGTDSPSSKLHVMGNITNTGQIVTYNPANPSASVALSWQNNIARIRVGGSGNGASSGFHFQGPGDKTLLRINGSGDIGIGTTNPDAKLTVAGDIHSREVKVTVNAGADFVFEDNYNLPTLEEVQQFINENGHLPEIASAKDMEANGIHLAEMNIKLLQKIEELTLYAIEQEEKLKEQEKEIKENSNLKVEVEQLKVENEILNKKMIHLENQLNQIINKLTNE